MDLRRVRKAAEEQGWLVEKTSHGWMFKAPDRLTQVLVHHDPPEASLKKAVARMRNQGGFVWPWLTPRRRPGG